MAQIMIEIDINKKLENIQENSTQTEQDFSPEFHIKLSKNKHVKFYKSKCYKDYILTINTNNSKKIVITKNF